MLTERLDCFVWSCLGRNMGIVFTAAYFEDQEYYTQKAKTGCQWIFVQPFLSQCNWVPSNLVWGQFWWPLSSKGANGPKIEQLDSCVKIYSNCWKHTETEREQRNLNIWRNSVLLLRKPPIEKGLPRDKSYSTNLTLTKLQTQLLGSIFYCKPCFS